MSSGSSFGFSSVSFVRHLLLRAAVIVAGVVAVIPAWGQTAPADTAAAVAPLTIGRWLALGPIGAPLPALADDDPAHKVGVAELLAQPPLPVGQVRPRAGQEGAR